MGRVFFVCCSVFFFVWLFVVFCFLLGDFIFMVVISTEWNGGCGRDWFFDDYWVLQLEWSEEISRESELMGDSSCWGLGEKRWKR